MSVPIDKWLLVEWGNGARGVVHSRYMVNRENLILRAGCTITISKRGEQQIATYIARSNDRPLLEQIIGDEVGPSVPPEPEVEDYSLSASSWVPSEDDISDSEYETKRRMDIAPKRYPKYEKRSKKVMKPTNKVQPVIPNPTCKPGPMNIKTYINSRKRPHASTKQANKNKDTPKPKTNVTKTITKNKNVNGKPPKLVTITLDINVIYGMFGALNKLGTGLGIFDNDETPKRKESDNDKAIKCKRNDNHKAPKSNKGNKHKAPKSKGRVNDKARKNKRRHNDKASKNKAINKYKAPKIKTSDNDSAPKNKESYNATPQTKELEYINNILVLETNDRFGCDSDEFNRSDDNVLISNKYQNIEDNEAEHGHIINEQQVHSTNNNNTVKINNTDTSQTGISQEQAEDIKASQEAMVNDVIQKEATVNNTKQPKILHVIQQNITPKTVQVKETESKTQQPKISDVAQKEKNDHEWVPIGSGKTLIEKDKFRRVKWTSYTIATRTLLLALFPRRTLATHSLTGKKSPAFQHKPAKMCLDPKKINDIIIEVTDRFNVKENLVRSIITTKCADESKMFRTRMKKRALLKQAIMGKSDDTNKENNQL